MRTRPVREDDRGIYVINNGQKHRPGAVTGYDHAYRMDACGLKKGDYVVVRNVSRSPLCKIVCWDLTAEGGPVSATLHWISEDQYYEDDENGR